MDLKKFRAVSSALVIICAAAPGSATLATRSNASVLPVAARPIQRRMRLEGNKRVVVNSVTLCNGRGASSFMGEGGSPQDVNNAGGQYSGVSAGYGNYACDEGSGIGVGHDNVINGYGYSYAVYSMILAGSFNGLDGGDSSIVGAGTNNLLTLGYLEKAQGIQTAPNASIVSGLTNTVEGMPQAFIGAGSYNVIKAVTSNNAQFHGQNSFVGGGANNSILAASNGGIVAGQYNSVAADYGGVVAGYQNFVSGSSSGILAGTANIVGNTNAAVVSGQSNRALASSSFIGGGQANTVTGQSAAVVGGNSNSASSNYSFVGGGQNNTLPGGQTNGGIYGVIAGGYGNSIPPNGPNSGEYAAIGGGYGNKVTGGYATIAAGYTNVVAGTSATISGGSTNSASGLRATVPGGFGNLAKGTDSFSAGTSSNAANDGTFVWSDYSSNATALASTSPNQFLARAAGGFLLYSSANLSTGVTLAPGSGSWSSLSDRASKMSIAPVDTSLILAKISSLPISEWSYTEQGDGIRHIGPMAQDFRSAFGLGEDDRHITTIDEEGVALAAIKALQAELVEKDRKLIEVRRSDDQKFARLEQRLELLEHNAESTKLDSGS